MFDDRVYTEFKIFPADEPIHQAYDRAKSFTKEIVWESGFEGPIQTGVKPPSCYLVREEVYMNVAG